MCYPQFSQYVYTQSISNSKDFYKCNNPTKNSCGIENIEDNQGVLLYRRRLHHFLKYLEESINFAVGVKLLKTVLLFIN